MVALFSASAISCPNLNGRFLCKAFSNGKDQDITIVQSTDNRGIAMVQMSVAVQGERTSVRNYIADGVTRPLVRDGYADYTNRAFCEAGMLKIHVKGTGLDADHPHQDGIVIFRLDANNNLYDSYSGKWGSNPNKFFEETCTRQ